MDYSTIDKENERIRDAYYIQPCQIIKKDSDGEAIVHIELGGKSEPIEYRFLGYRGAKIGEWIDVATLVNYNQQGYATSYKLVDCGFTPTQFCPKKGCKRG